MFLQRSLVCFYCGRRSAQKRLVGPQKWRCTSCEALNYLDQSGNIVDPPASETVAPSTRYGSRAESIASPELASPQKSLFCDTCLKNQYLVTHNLAEYLPDSSDPRYPAYEKNLNEYRKSLEARYPQVCQKCAPRVRDRLRTTGYAAKTDHLRRLAESTRRKAIRPTLRPGTRILLALGCFCWWSAHLVQIVWHIVMLAATEAPPIRDKSTERILVPSHLERLLRWATLLAQSDAIASAGLISLVLAICSLWWNPTLTRASWQRVHGLSEFYKTHLILTAARFLFWYLLQHETAAIVDPRVRRFIHATALGFNLFAIAVSWRAIRVTDAPPISFDVKDALIPSVPGSIAGRSLVQGTTEIFPTERLEAAQISAPVWTEPVTPHSERFSDENETIETETVDSDAMDVDTPERNMASWTPRRTHVLPTNHQPSAPSPFRGHLPPAPISQAHRLRNPPNKPYFQRASESRQKAFFESMTHSDSPASNGLWEQPATKESQNIEIKPPSFFASEQPETGLEALFSGLISLSDEPQEIRQMRGSPDQQPPAYSMPRSWKLCLAFAETTLAVCTAAQLSVSMYYSPWDAYLPTVTLSVVFIGALYGIFDRLRPSQPVMLFSDVVFYLAELVLSAGLLASRNPSFIGLERDEYSTVAIERGFLWFFAVHKVCSTCQAALVGNQANYPERTNSQAERKVK